MRFIYGVAGLTFCDNVRSSVCREDPGVETLPFPHEEKLVEVVGTSGKDATCVYFNSEGTTTTAAWKKTPGRIAGVASFCEETPANPPGRSCRKLQGKRMSGLL